MASRPANTSKRTSAAMTSEPVAKPPPCKIHSLAVVSDKAQITGSHTVELCDNSVLHPHCKIKADHGIVYVGRSTIICEATIIGVTEGEGNVIIGDGVLIEAGATIEAKSIGDGTVIEAKAKIGKGAMIGKHCKISPLSEIAADEQLSDYTVVFGDNQRRHNQTMADNLEVRDAKRRGQELHIEMLKKLIPNASHKWT
ncbi:Putative trimeric LpxA-like superfamily, dynactin subunit 6 [Septoria linicola]|uniref:Dynactin subunit 6 n=1 Tax=Septoria linicola TaxID=215465 RepID=A0A9Q9EJ86_9PEZI|nr:putative trimeric LpxA-like superfamily, dynactin subunit 6 [Septoria linicola]USW51944.1 Putative trimeric LpxA-like superfamily, dynactin subunit 6 [Septoria linicola]